MEKYLLDTDISIFFLRDKFEIESKVKSVGIQNCFIAEITVAELLFGAEYSSDIQKHLTQVRSFEHKFSVLPIYEAFPIYAKEKARLWREGKKIAEFDLLIGTTAVFHQLTMVTRNRKHFERIENIQIEDWIDSKFNEFL